MQSAFNGGRRPAASSSRTIIDETYDLRGLDQLRPDQVMAETSTPHALNSRMYARDDGDSRVAIRTRKGSTRLTTAVGEALDAENASAETGDLAFTTTRIIAQPFEALTSLNLVRMDFELKRDDTSRGHVMVEIRADNDGVPGTLLAASSILSSNITTAYQYLPSYFIDAPTLIDGTQYWALLFIQDNGGGSYYVQQTADAGALDLESEDEQESWNTLGVSFRFKSYVANNTPVIGYHRRYPSDGRKRTLFAAGTSVYQAQDNGTVAEIDAAVSASASKVRFDYVNDRSMWVDGYSALKWFDGDTVSNVANAPSGAHLVKIHQGRAFVFLEKTLARFSDLYDFESWPSVNFFYVPDPKSNDPVTGARVFQDDLIIFTRETKHRLMGTDISSFTRREAVGTKGAVSDEAIAVDKNAVYFMADDGHIYAWNGANDILLSRNLEPELSSIVDKTQVRLHLYNNQLRVYYAKEAGPNNRMALYDIEDKEWFIDTGRLVAGSLELTQDDNELIEFSSRAAWLFNGEQMYSDVGKPIDWQYYTKYKAYGSGASRKRVRLFRPFLRTVDANYTMLVGKDMDFANDPDMREYIVSGGGAVWGDFVWGDGTRWGKRRMVDARSGMSGRGKHIQYRFERSGVETPVEMYGYHAQVKIGRPR